ncbi:hypothetical protein D5S18_13345 [Nocardia panacis]|uniref:Uncharacterized protein n=1 Tax=Nocardia panacis TaxID=2340916 RepID=A0A3A4KRJ5_9NOCA|nr:hypothetical protein [Nocardia panacis]RJO75768.1 hypothetical protein D5S18_13345 [Nocardia panacis]
MPLLTVRLPSDATLADAMRALRLGDGDVDIAYGLIPVDPLQGLYALRITDDAAERIDPQGDGSQLFSDPPIGPAS